MLEFGETFKFNAVLLVLNLIHFEPNRQCQTHDFGNIRTYEVHMFNSKAKGNGMSKYHFSLFFSSRNCIGSTKVSGLVWGCTIACERDAVLTKTSRLAQLFFGRWFLEQISLQKRVRLFTVI